MTHAYSVRPRDSRGPVRTFDEPGLEAAVAAFLEDWAPAGDDHQAAVIVRELETGCEHCFSVDLDTGEAQPCD